MGRHKKKPVAKDLGNWLQFNASIMKMGEEEVKALIKREEEGKARLMYLLRLNARLSRLRRERERLEIAKVAK